MLRVKAVPGSACTTYDFGGSGLLLLEGAWSQHARVLVTACQLPESGGSRRNVLVGLGLRVVGDGKGVVRIIQCSCSAYSVGRLLRPKTKPLSVFSPNMSFSILRKLGT